MWTRLSPCWVSWKEEGLRPSRVVLCRPRLAEKWQQLKKRDGQRFEGSRPQIRPTVHAPSVPFQQLLEKRLLRLSVPVGQKSKRRNRSKLVRSQRRVDMKMPAIVYDRGHSLS